MAATIAISCDASEFEISNVISVRLVPEADVGVVFAILLEIDQLVDTTADNLYFGQYVSSLARVQYLPSVVPLHSFCHQCFQDSVLAMTVDRWAH